MNLNFNVNQIPIDIMSAIHNIAESTYANAMGQGMQPADPNSNPIPPNAAPNGTDPGL